MIQSIRGRFLIVSVLSVLAAMALAGFALVALFTNSLERRIHQELTDHINNITGALTFAADGTLLPPVRPIDARFDRPYSGLYWQVEDDHKGVQLRSESLWDYVLPLPVDDQKIGETDRYSLKGPDNSQVIIQEQMLLFAAPDGQRPVRVAVAMDAKVLTKARNDFAEDIIPYMVAIAAFLIAASLAQLTFGLKPLYSVSEGLNRIRERQAERLTGPFPRELSAVVEAVNRLLDAQSETIKRARSRAADLAHGLKTPLTVLSNDAETLKERGEKDIGEELAHLATVMRSHVDRELSRSRIAATGALSGKSADLSLGVERIVRTLKRTPRGEYLDWQVTVATNTPVPLDQQDLEEMLGNVIDNAVKWARSSILIQFDEKSRRLVIEDDGPGANPHDISRLMERGTRLDLTTPGTGLGLSIVHDIATAYDLSICIENRLSGGLRFTLNFTPDLSARTTP